MKKRGQFTILVVFAFIALLAVGLVLMFSSSSKKERIDVSAEEALNDFLQGNSVSNYVSSCLKIVSEEALKNIGLQGGFLWADQGGPVVMEDQASTLGTVYMPRNFGGKNFNVGYVLLGNDRAACSALKKSSLAPDYPYPGKNTDELNDLSFFRSVCPADRNSGFYGSRKLKSLCVINGPNWQGDPSQPSVYSTCEGGYDYARRNPLQHQLSNYTANNLISCAKFSNLEQRHGFDVEIQNSPVVDFVFGKEGVVINASYPVTISFKERPPLRSRVSFSHRADIRFKELYEFFWDLLIQDVWNSNFDFVNDYEKSLFYRDGFSVDVAKNFCPGCKNSWEPSEFDDLLIVEDEISSLQGKPLIIAGVIKNRPPVLNPLRKKFMVDFSEDVNRELYEEFGISIVTVNNSNVLLEPDAVDVDGDSVTYSYNLWHGNYTTDPGDLKPECILGMQDFLGKLRAGSAPTAYDHMTKVMDLCKEERQIFSGNSWEKQSNNKDARVRVPKDDFGVHTVRVTSSDSSTLDYQDVKILVIRSDLLTDKGFDYVVNCESDFEEFEYCG